MELDSNPAEIGRRSQTPAPSPRQIFDHWYQPVYRFFLKQGFSREDSLELAQETFLRAFRSIDELRSHEAVRSWILRIAANVWKKELRHRGASKRKATEIPLDQLIDLESAESEPPPPTALSTDESPLQQALIAERITLVRQALQELPIQRQRCLLLYAGKGLKYREIAAMLQLSLNTVRSHIHQGRQQLKDRLQHQLAEKSS